MTIVRCSLTSPFGRKIQVAAHHLELSETLRFMPAKTADPLELASDNPLSKMPVLIADDGLRIYDSRVILEYLDALCGGGRIIPVQSEARIRCLVTQALADGLLDAALLILYEAQRPPEFRHQPWIERQRGRLLRGMAALELAPPAATEINVATIATACMLNYLDRRQPMEWRTVYLRLVDWFDNFRAAFPAFPAVFPESVRGV